MTGTNKVTICIYITQEDPLTDMQLLTSKKYIVIKCILYI